MPLALPLPGRGRPLVFYRVPGTIQSIEDSLQQLRAASALAGFLPIHYRVEWMAHALLSHLALIHVPRALIEVAERREGRDQAQHEGGVDFLVRELAKGILQAIRLLLWLLQPL